MRLDLTRFWAAVVVEHLAAGATASRFHGVRSAVAALGEARNWHAAHYRFDVTRDPAARAIGWRRTQ